MGPALEPLQSGSRFADRFEIESPLGQGAFAATYLARDLFRRQRVVLKVFPSAGAEVLEAAGRETRVAQALNHPNVVSILDSGVAGSRAYIASEWVDGASLDTVLQAGPLPLQQTIAACTGIAGALRQAHSLGIIHRDLKPSNVLVPGWPQRPDFAGVRLLDFGVAGALKPSTQATQAGMIFGTPVYMSPEQVLGEPQTTATDIYALGLLLYEMLTGRKLREGKDFTTLFRAILEESVPPLPPSVPPYLARLIGESLRRDPGARPTLDQFADVLRQSPTVEAPPLSAPSPPSPRAARRPVWAAVAVGFALCAAALLGVLLVLRNPQPSSAFPAVFAGAFLVVVGVGAGFWVRGRLSRTSSELKSQALSLAVDARQHVDVSATIALQVSDLVGRLRRIDERILAGTVALMLNEYQRASEDKDRQSALMNVVALSEKLGQRLSPWYVRYKDVIATLVAMAGAVSGLLTAYNGLHHK
jgi:eukaryotic-like serine/threonine-protein kinase